MPDQAQLMAELEQEAAEIAELQRQIEHDPLPVRTDHIEADDKKEASAALGFLKSIGQTVEQTMGNGYWLTMVFATPAQRDEFVAKSAWSKHADSLNTYYDGIAIAAELGVELTPATPRFREAKADRRLVEEVGIIGD